MPYAVRLYSYSPSIQCNQGVRGVVRDSFINYHLGRAMLVHGGQINSILKGVRGCIVGVWYVVAVEDVLHVRIVMQVIDSACTHAVGLSDCITLYNQVE